MQVERDDCMRACLATYFSVPLADVPILRDDEWMQQVRDWVRPRGLGFITIAVPNEAVFRERFSEGLLIVSGPSARGVDHAVLYLDGKLWHDPHPSGAGIQGVMQADFFYALSPQMPPLEFVCFKGGVCRVDPPCGKKSACQR